MVELVRFDPVEEIDNAEAVAVFLADAFDTGDADYIQHMLGLIARSKGMAEVAEKAGLGRESLYKALKDGASPRFDTILRVVHALDLKLALVSAAEANSAEDADDEAAA
ncbi:putative addiction module antidote protein [Caulobacter vibrioides]|uniref:type II toxin-antitoxin system antitoxin HigA n=1 Tax=Caulobacter vibrioides TaxID=155892 RepID=UPI000BB4BECA|nr:type II toxin-antitoxin system antitoxin HigA [Caulobacter vibrioides]ATC26802.1 putative addiction module antidote protein [Caulobacter vibrioides]AZH14858.1 putative addiction module antidote protein [Caulobacter vibrioides]PLR16536.1 putative addiction module antidote protein [Caulobacter vibrioides]